PGHRIRCIAGKYLPLQGGGRSSARPRRRPGGGQVLRRIGRKALALQGRGWPPPGHYCTPDKIDVEDLSGYDITNFGGTISSMRTVFGVRVAARAMVAGLGVSPDARVEPAPPPGAEAPARRGPGRPRAEHPKRVVKLRVDHDVVEYFRAGGPGWQTRMNAA